MALAAFCTVCQRTVYVEDEATPVCPVCSSPLLETAAVERRLREQESAQDEDAEEAQPGGS